LHLGTGVAHAVAHVHVRVLRMEVDPQCFTLDLYICGLTVGRSGRCSCPWDSCLPGAAIGKERTDSDDERCEPERYFFHFWMFLTHPASGGRRENIGRRFIFPFRQRADRAHARHGCATRDECGGKTETRMRDHLRNNGRDDLGDR
jgi:hypothetical protein